MTYKYFAFISYSSHDTKWGKRLQRKLKHYRMPATLCGEQKWESKTPMNPVFFAPTNIHAKILKEIRRIVRENAGADKLLTVREKSDMVIITKMADAEA